LQEPFGGINIVLCGDTKQLLPIGDPALWNIETKSKKELVKAGQILYKQFKTVVFLTEVMRQVNAEQEAFRNTLLRIRSCNANLQDYELLRTRVMGIAENTEEILSKNPIHLVPTRQMAHEYNMNKLIQLSENTGEAICTINAVHNNKTASKLTSDHYQNLENTIQICRGARVMVTANLWVDRGIMNGAFGTVRHIIYDSNSVENNMPNAIVLEMDQNYTGPSVPGLPERHIVLNTKTNFTYSGNIRLERTQFPIVLAYSMTIHKCQGKNFKQKL
jgi:ATP-dependent DNA helicase PIF1